MRKLLLGMLVAAGLSAFSCRAGISHVDESETASVVLNLSGLLTASSAAAKSSRVTLPVTDSLLVSIRRASESAAHDGSVYKKTFSLAGNPSISIDSLPQGTRLVITAAAYSSLNPSVLLSSSSVATALSPGRNTLAFKLLPPDVPANPVTLTSAGDEAAFGADPLAVNGVSCLNLEFGSSGYFQLLFQDGGDNRSVWLALYDENWNALPTITADQYGGWAVVEATAGQKCYAVICNCADNSGYPQAAFPASAAIQLRDAVFVSADSSIGAPDPVVTSLRSSTLISRSTAPTAQSLLSISSSAATSYFAAEGDYAITSVAIDSDVRLYGGFSSDDWAVRDTTSHATVIAGSGSQASVYLGLNSTFSGCLDGLTIVGPASANGLRQTSAVYSVQCASPALIRNCTLEATISNGMTYTSSDQIFAALFSTEAGTATLEVSESTLSGSSLSNQAYDVNTAAIYATEGTIYIHNCDIDGGTVLNGVNVHTYGVYEATDAAVVAAACRIWGGRGSSGEEGPAVASSAFYSTVTNSSSVSIIANCLLSGGYTDAIYRYTNAICGASPYLLITGNVIDAGSNYNGLADLSWCLNFTSSTSIAMIVAGNVLMSTNSSTDTLVYQSSANLYSMVGNTFLTSSSSLLTTATGAENTTWANNDTVNTLPSNAFTGYLAAETFEAWITEDLHPVAAFTPYLCGGDYLGYYPSLYPALLLDRAGTARPASGTYWTVGAYQ